MSFLFIFLAAFFNAVMDALENENFYESIFNSHAFDKSFWYKRESWKTAKRLFGYKFDGWHMAKSAMIISLVLAVVLYEVRFSQLIDFALMGILWNFTFWLFYHKVFGVK